MSAIDYFSRRRELAECEEENRFSSVRVDNISNMAIDHFIALSGMTLDYYGCDASCHTFKVDNIIFKVLEDPDDGYRSCLGAIDYTEEDENTGIFYRHPISEVKISPWSEEDGQGSRGASGYKIVEETTGHCWLEFGTQYYDEYYPMFYFKHFPKTND